MTIDHHRCSWAEGDALMRAYHDEEWGVPQHDSRMLWEMLMLEGFQAGLSWITVLKKRDAFRKAFANFDPKKVARFGESDVERLMADAGIIRARAKIVATIRGAQIFCEMQKQGESFNDFCWSFTAGKALKSNGRSRLTSSVSRLAQSGSLAVVPDRVTRGQVGHYIRGQPKELRQ